MKHDLNPKNFPFINFVPKWVFFGIPIGFLGFLGFLALAARNPYLSRIAIFFMISGTIYTFGAIVFFGLGTLQWRIIDIITCLVFGSLPCAIWSTFRVHGTIEASEIKLFLIEVLFIGMICSFVGIVLAKGYLKKVSNLTSFQRIFFNILGILQIFCMPFCPGLVLFGFLYMFGENDTEIKVSLEWCIGGTVLGVASFLLSVRLSRRWENLIEKV